MTDGFKIDINSAANSVWLPKVPGETFYSMNDWDDVVVNLATHNSNHTKKYFTEVYDRVRDAYEYYCPNGLNLDKDDLQKEGANLLHSNRKDLIEGRLPLGLVK